MLLYKVPSEHLSSGKNQGASTIKQTEPLSLEDFRKRKEADRSSRFKPKTGGKRAKQSVEVKVKGGIVQDKNGDGILTKVKSRTITIAVSSHSNAETLLQKAIEKHARHYQQFNKNQKYVILYHDLSIVKNLPKSSMPFVLSEYKEDLLLPYSKMYFWLCTETDFENSMSDESSDNDAEIEEISSMIVKNPVNQSSSTALPTTSHNNIWEVQVSGTTNTKNNQLPTAINTGQQSSSVVPSKHSIDTYLVPHQCPTCLGHFSRTDIEEHADMCAESWVDPIGDVEPNENEDNPDIEEIIDLPGDLDDFVHQTEEARKRVVEKLQHNVIRTTRNRVNIRRRECFSDYVDARRKKWFKPEGILKITFSGEPAVDGGGPRREFFTGKCFLNVFFSVNLAKTYSCP